MIKKIPNNSININNLDETLVLYGWVNKLRKLKNITFVELRDQSGIIQLTIPNHLEISLSKEDIIQVKGQVKKRDNANLNIETGEIEILVEQIQLLSKSSQLPFEIDESINAKDDLRLKYRFLDLKNKQVYPNLILKNKIKQAIHQFLNSQNFCEIETPILGRITPEGSKDFIVPTRKDNLFFALPQSPQLYKQLLMMSGFEKYYQIARCFRDETSRKDRQLEFSQLDIEMSFIDEENIMDLVEKLIVYVFNSIGHKIQIPFQRLNFDDVMEKYGSDKPDLRFGHLLEDINEIKSKLNNEILKNSEYVKMIQIPYLIDKKQISILEEEIVKNHAKKLLYFTIDNNNVEGNFKKLFPDDAEIMLKNIKIKNYNNSSVFFIFDKKEIVNQSLGALRVKLNELFDFPKSEEFNFSWIINWPLYEYSEEEQKYQAAHHPFTKAQDAYLDNFDKQHKNAKARAYDLVLNGYELGSGSIRINNLDMQIRMFKSIGLSDKQIESQFGFFLDAFKFGIPPHGGIALGIDRILAIITDSKSIREVIAFPKNSKGMDPLTQAPSTFDEDLLKEYNLSYAKK